MKRFMLEATVWIMAGSNLAMGFCLFGEVREPNQGWLMWAIAWGVICANARCELAARKLELSTK